MFISLSSTCIQNFSNWYAPFIVLSHSVAVVAWSEIQRVDPRMIHFELFITWCTGASSTPKQYFLVWAAKKVHFGHSPRKDNHACPLPQQGFCTSLQIGDELGVTWQTKQRVFCHLRGL